LPRKVTLSHPRSRSERREKLYTPSRDITVPVLAVAVLSWRPDLTVAAVRVQTASTWSCSARALAPVGSLWGKTGAKHASTQSARSRDTLLSRLEVVPGALRNFATLLRDVPGIAECRPAGWFVLLWEKKRGGNIYIPPHVALDVY